MMRSVLFIAAVTTVDAACDSAATCTVKLNNGVEMPVLAFGANVWDADTCKQATADAIKAGFRFIWSSALIGQDCQAAQAAAIAASGIARKDMFIAGTVNTGSCSGMDDCYTQTKSDAEGQLQTLGVSQLDMLMLDYPSTDQASIQGQWKAFSEMYQANKTRTIGVSNFSPEQIGYAIKQSGVVPVANQMPYSVGHGSDTVVADDAKLGVVVQAYSPLEGGSLPSDPDCVSIGKKHNKTGAQVALRWIVQRNATICTESTDATYLQADASIFDFTLTDAEMSTLNAK